MTRELLSLDGGDREAVAVALRASLDGSGPAIRVTPASTHPEPASVVGEVARRIAVVVETSGSTGAPKRVALGGEALLTGASATDAALGGPGQWLLCLPVHYIAGLQVLVRSIAAQSDPVVLGGGHFDPGDFVRAAATMTGDRRYVSVVPVQLSRLVDHADVDLDAAAVLRRFDAVLVGGQATPLPLLDRARRLGVRVVTTYGASETAGGCVYDGIPIGQTEVRIVDGLVELGGSVVAEGYLDERFVLDEAATAAAFSRRSDAEHRSAHWYRTGDVGGFDGDRLEIVGRADSVIVSGGEKVSLDAVERVLHDEGFPEAVVVRVPHAEWGEAPAVAVPAEGGGSAVEAAAEGPVDDALMAEIRRIVVGRLGRAARPLAVVRLPEMPRLASGKPDRRAIRDTILHRLPL